MKILFFRHGQTKGNLEHQYIGITNQPLCKEGIEVLEKSEQYPKIDIVYVTPMLRTKETANIIFPNAKQIEIKGFAEMNFGDFEGKNYKNLSDNKDYISWVDSECEGDIPNGERKSNFTKRSCNAFEKVVEENLKYQSDIIAIVAHGGTIMSIFSEYIKPKQDYFSWKTSNGSGWLLEVCKENWNKNKKIKVIKYLGVEK